MGKVITLGLQKGGVSKTTTTGILAYMLARDGYKVLAVDMDSQGNLSELLTNLPANEFFGKSIFEAIVTKDPGEYTYEVNENLHVLPANNFFASYPRWIYTNYVAHLEEYVSYEGSISKQLALTLDKVKDQYDFILIDTPPALSEHTTNALVASDYVIVLYECSKFCYSAIPNFMGTIESVQKNSSANPDLKVIGLLRTLNDRRRKDAKFFNDLIESEYPELVFETIITRKASTGRLALHGFEDDNEELKEAISQFEKFYNELLSRLKGSETND